MVIQEPAVPELQAYQRTTQGRCNIFVYMVGYVLYLVRNFKIMTCTPQYLRHTGVQCSMWGYNYVHNSSGKRLSHYLQLPEFERDLRLYKKIGYQSTLSAKLIENKLTE